MANVGKTTEKGIPGEVIALHSISGLIFYPPSLRMKSGLLLVRGMLASLLADTVYLSLF